MSLISLITKILRILRDKYHTGKQHKIEVLVICFSVNLLQCLKGEEIIWLRSAKSREEKTFKKSPGRIHFCSVYFH